MQTTITIMQGDQYAIPVEIKDVDGTPANGETFADVEIVVGSVRRTMSAGEIVYDPNQAAFLFPLTQAETFAMRDQPQIMQIRVKTVDGNVLGVNLGGTIIVIGSKSKEEL